MRLNPYLTFKGDCEAAFKLYERVTGGKITAMMRFEGSPMAADVPPEWRNKVIHARLEMGQDALMGSDASPQHYKEPQGYSITLRVDTPEEAEKAFKDLSDGATIGMALDKTFFAKKFGMLVDKFGTHWMVICENAH
ncbi:MAG TPA: VOC family protein [Xanthobacteraceae bacterium]|jgi:PhnB protein